MDGYWIGPYDVLVSNSLKSCMDEDGINQFYPDGSSTEEDSDEARPTKNEWLNKYAIKIGNTWFYKENLLTKITDGKAKSFISKVREETRNSQHEKDKIDIMKAAKSGINGVSLYGEHLEIRRKMLEDEKFEVYIEEDGDCPYMVVTW